MDTAQSPKRTTMRAGSRKSIAHVPSNGMISDKENLTLDAAGLVGSTVQSMAALKGNRSKSMGPEDLAALRVDAGNRQKVDIEHSLVRPS